MRRGSRLVRVLCLLERAGYLRYRTYGGKKKKGGWEKLLDGFWILGSLESWVGSERARRDSTYLSTQTTVDSWTKRAGVLVVLNVG